MKQNLIMLEMHHTASEIAISKYYFEIALHMERKHPRIDKYVHDIILGCLAEI